MATVPLVTLQAAKDQLGITHGAQDAFVQTKTEQATALILAYADKAAAAAVADAWTVDTVPDDVKSVILEAVGYLYAKRGDQDEPASSQSSPWDGFPTPFMKGKLTRWKTLVVA